MAEIKKYLHTLDIGNNKIINLLLNPLTTSQRGVVGGNLTSSDEGYVCYDTDENVLYFWDTVINDWVASGGGGSQTLQDVTDLGNTTTNNIQLLNAAETIYGAGGGILLDNGSRLREGTIAGYGGYKGIAQICSVGYELKWESGRLYIMNNGGTTIREVRYTFGITPGLNDDITVGYTVGSRWVLDNGDVYTCTDDTTNSATWVLTVNGVPTLQQVTDAGNSTTNDIILNGGILGVNGGTFSKNYYFSNQKPSNSNGSNLIIGNNSGSVVNGNNNISLGHNGLSSTTTDNNIAIGNEALLLQTGSNNIAIGYSAGFQQKGEYNIILGHNAATTVSPFNYTALFGRQAIATASEQIVFSKDGTIMERLGTDLLTASRLHKFPNANGTLALSVNGVSAGTDGDITISIPTSLPPSGTAGGDLNGTYPNPTVDGLQGNAVSAVTPTSGQILQWNTSANAWVPGAVPTGGSGGGGITYYFNYQNTTGISPTTGLPTSPVAPSQLGISYSVGAGSIDSANLTNGTYIFICGFVTIVGTPGITDIPAGLWDFNIWADVVGHNGSANQTQIQIRVYKYDGTTGVYTSLANSDDIYVYDPNTIAQYIGNVTMPQTTLLSTDRIYIEFWAQKNVNQSRQISFHFDSLHPSHVHTTIPSVAGTGLVKVVNGVYQSPATLLVNADVSASAAIDATKIANGSVSNTEFQYLDGVTSSIQTQLGTKATDSLVVHLAGTETITGAKTFLDTTLLLRNVANTFNGSFTNTNTADRIYTLPNLDTTLAGLAVTQTFTSQNIFTGGLRTSGNLTTSAWGLTGINTAIAAATYTDNSSSGTVAAVAANTISSPTFAASSTTTYTDAYNTYITGPIAGTNTTLTNRWGLGVAAPLLINSNTGVTSDAFKIQFNSSTLFRVTENGLIRTNAGVIYSAENNASFQINGPSTTSNTSDIIFGKYGSFNSVSAGSPKNHIIVNGSWLNQNDAISAVININPTYNFNANTTSSAIMRGVYYNPSITTIQTSRHIAWENTTGYNFLNTSLNSTRIGTSTILFQGSLYDPKLAIVSSSGTNRAGIHNTDNTSGTVYNALYSGFTSNFANVISLGYTSTTDGNTAAGVNFCYLSNARNGYFSFPVITSGGTVTSNMNAFATNLYFQASGSALNYTSHAMGYRSAVQLTDPSSLGITVATISDFYVDNVAISTGTGTVTTRYGLNIAMTNANTTNAWGIYQSNANVKNYFNGSVGLGTTTINASAILDITSTTKGFLPPRMTNAQRTAISSPAIGLIVYCTDTTEGLYINKSTGWTFII